MAITKAQLRALQAVADDKVQRVYNLEGNTFGGPAGIAPVNYWKLERRNLIKDGPDIGVVVARCKMVLTDAGRSALAASTPEGGG